MRIRSFLFLFINLLIIANVSAQSILNDTMQIDEVTVIGHEKEIEKTAIGGKVTQMDTALIARNATKSLSELLSENSTINIKSLGQGALSTAAFRGTSSNHTQVLWNGVSLNSVSLGSFDFSQIPIYFTDNVSLLHGSSSQQSGSGALGGSVNFTNDNKSVAKPQISILGEYGSNNTITGGGTFRVSKGGFTSNTRVFYQHSDNDYKYLNKVYSKDSFYERRKDAEYEQFGAMQEFYYNAKNGGKFGFVSWWQYDDRSIPQTIISQTVAKETTTTQNWRNVAYYDTQKGAHRYKILAAALWTDMEHRRIVGDFKDVSCNDNSSYIVKGDYAYEAHRKVTVGATVQNRYDEVISESYEGDKANRNTVSVRAYTVYRPWQKLHFDLDITGEMQDTDVYGIYNVSARYMAMPGLLTFKASNAYNHRMPTLNDLYWEPGGNTQLKPEYGFSYDALVQYTPSIGICDFDFELSYYYMDINDWIMWVPTNTSAIWSPVNFSSVISQGTEFSMKINVETANTGHSLTGNYGFAYSVDNSDNNEDAFGKQLPYIPRHKANLTYNFDFRKAFWFNYNLSYTGKRFTTADQEYYTNAYLINNAEVGYKFSFANAHNLKLSLRADNFFNAYYESSQYFPMPLRMFRLQLVYGFN